MHIYLYNIKCEQTEDDFLHAQNIMRAQKQYTIPQLEKPTKGKVVTDEQQQEERMEEKTTSK